MKISLLCSTLGYRASELKRCVQSLNEQSYTNFELIVVSQDNHYTVAEALGYALFAHKHVMSRAKGISAGRNAGLPYVSGDVLMLTDDDCWYDPAALEVVAASHISNNCPIICFRHLDPKDNSTYKKYPRKRFDCLGYVALLSLASIDITFNLSLCAPFPQFDECFGVGTVNNCGEECILLTDLLKRGMRISYTPINIAYHPTKEASAVLRIRDITTKAALFRRLYGHPLGLLALMLYMFKNWRRLESCGVMLQGLQEYNRNRVRAAP